MAKSANIDLFLTTGLFVRHLPKQSNIFCAIPSLPHIFVLIRKTAIILRYFYIFTNPIF